MSAITSVGLKAYSNALADFARAQKEFESRTAAISQATPAPVASFSETLNDSLAKVNKLQAEKNTMVQAFASGENQNVHELMIAMQRAGLAVNLTSAVRGKVLEAYRELSKLQF